MSSRRGSGSTRPVTVLGVGNPIMGDDGIGLELLARLQSARQDDRIDYVDGVTGGMDLLPVVEDATRLLVLDAVAGSHPATAVHLTGDQIPRLLSAKLSPHQVGLLDVLAAARLLQREPDTIEVVGIVPEFVDLQVGLTESVRASLDDAVAQAVAVLDGWLAELDPAGSAEGGDPA